MDKSGADLVETDLQIKAVKDALLKISTFSRDWSLDQAEAQAKRLLITAEQTAKRDLAINGDQAAYDASMLQARTAYPTALDQSKQSRDAVAKNVRDKYADDQAATSKTFDDAMAGAEKEYELAESQADATYRKDKALAKKTHDTAVSGLDASYATTRDQSWVSTVTAAGVLGSDP